MTTNLPDLIYQAYEKKAKDGFRLHLGASEIGRECERRLWFSFRWAAREKFEGRKLRIFETGSREEQRVIENLREVGIQVETIDPKTGKQFHRSLFGGHFAGSCDGVINGDTIFECKTHNLKSFRPLVEKGLQAAKPEHWIQCQTYMGMFELKKALYVAVCKDDDEIYVEEVEFDDEVYQKTIKKAERVIFSDHAPPKIASNSEYWVCKLCPYRALCHGLDGTLPKEMNCRTCIHSAPELDGFWSCFHLDAILDEDWQRKGCDCHLVHINLVPRKQVAVDDDAIHYEGGLVNIRGGRWVG